MPETSKTVNRLMHVFGTSQRIGLLVSKYNDARSADVAVEMWRSLLIDRLHISAGISSKAMYGTICSVLQSMHGETPPMNSSGKLTVQLFPYCTRVNYYAGKKRKIADIQIATTKQNHMYFKLGLYPSKFVGDDFYGFKWWLSVVLEDFCYEKLYHAGRASYIELAVDSLSHTLHTFIPFRAKCNDSLIFFEGENPGSTYLGSRMSNLRFCIYDKHKQLLAKKVDSSFAIQTRIEARAKHTGLRPCDLTQLQNPFSRLELADLAAARQLSTDSDWQHFLDKCLILGSASALAQSPTKRNAYRTALRKVPATWWNPHGMWDDLPKALQKIVP